MNWSQDFTIKSNARRSARKAKVDPSKVQAFVKAGKTLYRFPMPAAAEAPKAAKSKTKPRIRNEVLRTKPGSGAKLPIAASRKEAEANFLKMTEASRYATPSSPNSKTGTTKAKARAGRTAKPSQPSGNKFEQVAAALRKPGGASITDIMEATGWLPHTARARISVDVSKLLNKGEEITRRREGGVSHYAIVKSKQQDLPLEEPKAA